MAKYEVEIKETEIYHIPVEADSEEEATNKAYGILDSSDKDGYHHDSGGGSEVYGEGELI